MPVFSGSSTYVTYVEGCGADRCFASWVGEVEWHQSIITLTDTGQDQFTLARDTRDTCTVPRRSCLCRTQTAHGMNVFPKPRLHVVCRFGMVLLVQTDERKKGQQGREGRNFYIPVKATLYHSRVTTCLGKIYIYNYYSIKYHLAEAIGKSFLFIF